MADEVRSLFDRAVERIQERVFKEDQQFPDVIDANAETLTIYGRLDAQTRFPFDVTEQELRQRGPERVAARFLDEYREAKRGEGDSREVRVPFEGA
jgi:hypothetical protein